jgi:hypothetical protein
MLSIDLSNEASLDAIRQLVDFAHYEGRYFDVVAFHCSERARYDAFLKEERKLFAMPEPSQYELS